MKPTESEQENQSETITPQSPLICGLPDDIALSCLARIPRKYHGTLSCVSKRWRDLVSSNEWRSYRQKHNLSETWIYALCRDRTEKLVLYVLDPNKPKRVWKRVQDPPVQCLKRRGVGFTVLGGKIYLMGGSSWVETADEVYCYNAACNTWSEAAPMPIKRSYFSCEALNDTIYTIGGIGAKDFEISCDVYNSITNTWNSRSRSDIVSTIEESVVLDGKIFIRCSAPTEPSSALVISYDPSNTRWQHADVDLARGWRGPAAVIDGSLYVLDQKLLGIKLMMWRADSREWVWVGRLSTLLAQPPCQLTAVGKSIFVVGKGLSTVVVDVFGSGVSNDGVLVSSSIPKSGCDEYIISCKPVVI